MRMSNSRGHVYKRSTNDVLLRGQRHRRSRRFNSVFERDLAAMAKVWRMLKKGTIRAFGEIGRQY
tara:strand:+ start:43 stop:237 length:195 start_codon:yes stop_codon:yes gene_type:complete